MRSFVYVTVIAALGSCVHGQVAQDGNTVDCDSFTGTEETRAAEWVTGLHQNCPKECTQDPTEVETYGYAMCVEGQEEYGEKCKATGACGQFLAQYDEQAYGCMGPMGGFWQLIAMGVSMGCTPSKFDDLPIHCPKDCTTDDAEVGTYRKCGDMEEEYGAACTQTGTCMSFIGSLTDTDYAALGFMGEITKFIISMIQFSCNGVECPAGGEGDAFAKLIGMDANCPKDCSSDGSDDSLPQCGEGEEEYGSACQATGTCASLMDSITDQDLACLGGLGALFAVGKEGIKTTCGGYGEISDAGAGCASRDMWYAANLMEFESKCARDCVEDGDMEGLRKCAAGEPEFGVKCAETSECADYLQSVAAPPDCPWAVEVTTNVQGLTMICGGNVAGCDTNLFTFLQGMDSNCPKDCFNADENDDPNPGLAPCDADQEEYGVKCRATGNCKTFLEEIAAADDEELACMGATNIEDFAYGVSWLSFKCDPENPASVVQDPTTCPNGQCFSDCPDTAEIDFCTMLTTHECVSDCEWNSCQADWAQWAMANSGCTTVQMDAQMAILKAPAADPTPAPTPAPAPAPAAGSDLVPESVGSTASAVRMPFVAFIGAVALLVIRS